MSSAVKIGILVVVLVGALAGLQALKPGTDSGPHAGCAPGGG